MASLNFVDSFVTFLALLGPQKILLSFDEASRTLPSRQARLLAVVFERLGGCRRGAVRADGAPRSLARGKVSSRTGEVAGHPFGKI